MPTIKIKVVTFKPELQMRIIILTIFPSSMTRSNHHKQKIRGPNDDVSKRTMSKEGHIDQNVGDRTRSKLQATCTSTKKESSILFMM
jgi:hypothetical protein